MGRTGNGGERQKVWAIKFPPKMCGCKKVEKTVLKFRKFDKKRESSFPKSHAQYSR